MSARAASRTNARRPAADFRSRTIAALAAIERGETGAVVPARAPICRVGSPSGGSTLITSAPMSHSCIAQKGPAITCPTSSTRIPSSAVRPVLIVASPREEPIVNDSDAHVHLGRSGRVLHDQSRRKRGNAMTWAMYDALVEACERVDADHGVRAFVIRATGSVFCTGTDISQFATSRPAKTASSTSAVSKPCLARLERVAVPTIAQVEGIAAGAGCAIALACDLRVCTPAARFGVPIARTLGNGLSFENCARLVEHFGLPRTKGSALHRPASSTRRKPPPRGS